MVDIGFAGFAHLSAVALVGIGVCLSNKLSRFFGQIVGNPVNQDLGINCRYPNSVTFAAVLFYYDMPGTISTISAPSMCCQA